MKNSHYIKEVKILTENNKNITQTSRIENKKKKSKKVKRIIYWTSIIIALSTLGLSISQMYHYYKAKKEWKKFLKRL